MCVWFACEISFLCVKFKSIISEKFKQCWIYRLVTLMSFCNMKNFHVEEFNIASDFAKLYEALMFEFLQPVTLSCHPLLFLLVISFSSNGLYIISVDICTFIHTYSSYHVHICTHLFHIWENTIVVFLISYYFAYHGLQVYQFSWKWECSALWQNQSWLWDIHPLMDTYADSIAWLLLHAATTLDMHRSL